SPSVAESVERGAPVAATIEDRPAEAVIEGIVPAQSGALYTINAIVENRDGAHQSGASATLRLPVGTRTGVMIPAGALVREGDLVGVRVMGAAGPELRWIRTGDTRGDEVEVLSGLRAGDQVLV